MPRSDDKNRGTGRTTVQMKSAPHGALFIWCNDRIDYARDIAHKLGRTDLDIRGPSILEEGANHLLGKTFTGIVVDHAAMLTDEQYKGLLRLEPYIRERTAADAGN